MGNSHSDAPLRPNFFSVSLPKSPTNRPQTQSHHLLDPKPPRTTGRRTCTAFLPVSSFPPEASRKSCSGVSFSARLSCRYRITTRSRAKLSPTRGRRVLKDQSMRPTSWPYGSLSRGTFPSRTSTYSKMQTARHTDPNGGFPEHSRHVNGSLAPSDVSLRLQRHAAESTRPTSRRRKRRFSVAESCRIRFADLARGPSRLACNHVSCSIRRA